MDGNENARFKSELFGIGLVAIEDCVKQMDKEDSEEEKLFMESFIKGTPLNFTDDEFEQIVEECGQIVIGTQSQVRSRMNFERCRINAGDS